MSNTWLIAVSAAVLVAASPALSPAANISTKKMMIKDGGVGKRAIAVQSVDPAVLLTDGDDPGMNGATLHAYSATDDFCAVLPAGPNWKKTKSVWKFADKATKNSAQIGDGKLSVKIKSSVTYTLADNGTQGAVNMQVQFGTGVKYCMRCSTPKKDTAKKYLAKACAAAPCDEEPPGCPPTTTTTTTTSTTTTTCPSVQVTGSLTVTIGHFNYNLMNGLPGANAACNSNFAGSHACTISELRCAPSSQLVGLKDTSNMTVMGFWAIDPTVNPLLEQCEDDVGFPCSGMPPSCPPGHTWEYATAHTMSRGQRVSLNNATGALGPLETSLQCNTFPPNNWVGCCQ